MRLKRSLIITACAGLAACGTNPTVLPPERDAYPGAGEALLDKANCPDADPGGEGVLHDPVDGSRGEVIAARAADSKMYTRCRSAFHGLIDHERARLEEAREDAEDD